MKKAVARTLILVGALLVLGGVNYSIYAKERIKSGVVVLASEHDGKVQVVVAVTADLTARIKAGQLVKAIAPIVGGGGGGRPDFAEAGGRHPEKIDEMFEAARAAVAKLA